ncbi:MAG: glycosyltransferase [Aliidiomarina sp.]|uniref:glycosyltransferase n=1 Tax=Aliidiomarina sp. TaxID=1872439 RepID=UPI0025BEEBE3|nr:glycosyltransferase [Aliidiomarina sp.]MCH8502448.1 glycosyltransferase [Aliidiomarina sp.]
MSAQTSLNQMGIGRQAFLAEEYRRAAVAFLKAYLHNPELEAHVRFNFDLIQARDPSIDFDALRERAFEATTDPVLRKRLRRFYGFGPVYKGFETYRESRYGQKLTSLLDKRNDNGALERFHDRNEQRILEFLHDFEGLDDASRPLISIIMPTYNRAEIVRESIDSALSQSYAYFELIICDDGSEDETEALIAAIEDPRVTYVRQDNQGAAAARNTALRRAKGDIIAYLDSDNYWHPAYLELVVAAFTQMPGRSTIYFDFIDFHLRRDGSLSIRSTERPAFNHEQLIERPFIDLNTFAHRRELYDLFGGFDQALIRRQDYDLILKYTWLRDPVHVPISAALYQRNDALEQITRLHGRDRTPVDLINQKIKRYFAEGLPAVGAVPVQKVSIIVWDHCRNHFSKPFAVAEALSETYEVELIAFDFFDEGVFAPLKDVKPNFTTKYFKGSEFPDFFAAMKAAAEAVTGDIMYVVKPRLPSLGIAMLVNATRAIPYVLEINDLETVVGSPTTKDLHADVDLRDVRLDEPELRNPYSERWSQLFDPLAQASPIIVTHNQGLDRHYGSSTLYMRNLKDERVYNPANYDRAAVRHELGFSAEDRVILFGGLIRRHKGIYELVELVERLNDPRYKLLFVGSRLTPDQKALADRFGDRIVFLPPQDREGMARINLAADLVILWLNPNVAASHYQFPYKATDAFAMNTPVIANDISDLGDLGRQGYLRLVPFGDWQQMTECVHELFANPDETSAMAAAGRRLYERQFGYRAARANFLLAAYRASQQKQTVYPVAERFRQWFDRFYQTLTAAPTAFLPVERTANFDLVHSDRALQTEDFGRFDVDQHIYFVEPHQSRLLQRFGDETVAVVLQGTQPQRALDAARLFVKRADHPIACFIVLAGERVAEDMEQTVTQLRGKYVLLADEWSFPCRNWLEFGHEGLKADANPFIFANTGQQFDPKIAADVAEYVFAETEFLQQELAAVAAKLEPNNGADNWWQQLGKRLRRYKRVTMKARLLVANMNPSLVNTKPVDQSSIFLVDVQNLNAGQIQFHQNICVVMPCIDVEKGLRSAQFLQQRAGISADFVVVNDTRRQGFIKTLNQAAQCSSGQYVVYLAEDAFPGEAWLQIAFETLESKKKSLLAFNCGKWHGRVAAFGMVRKDWVANFYADQVLFDEYKSHRADNEVTVLARASNQFAYTAKSVLLEDDRRKDFKQDESEAANFSLRDKKLFQQRFAHVYPKLVDTEQLASIRDEYLNQRKLAAEKVPLRLG